MRTSTHFQRSVLGSRIPKDGNDNVEGRAVCHGQNRSTAGIGGFPATFSHDLGSHGIGILPARGYRQLDGDGVVMRASDA